MPCAMESAATDMATLSTNRAPALGSQPSRVLPRSLRCTLLLGYALLLSACGRTAAVSTGSSSTSGSPPPAAIVVSISPLTATVPTGGAQVFTSTVTAAGNAATNVIWSVNGIADGNAALGTIAGSGASGNSTTSLYTAPATLPGFARWLSPISARALSPLSAHPLRGNHEPRQRQRPDFRPDFRHRH
jgi:hypothetical protein